MLRFSFGSDATLSLLLRAARRELRFRAAMPAAQVRRPIIGLVCDNYPPWPWRQLTASSLNRQLVQYNRTPRKRQEKFNIFSFVYLSVPCIIRVCCFIICTSIRVVHFRKAKFGCLDRGTGGNFGRSSSTCAEKSHDHIPDLRPSPQNGFFPFIALQTACSVLH